MVVLNTNLKMQANQFSILIFMPHHCAYRTCDCHSNRKHRICYMPHRFNTSSLLHLRQYLDKCQDLLACTLCTRSCVVSSFLQFDFHNQFFSVDKTFFEEKHLFYSLFEKLFLDIYYVYTFYWTKRGVHISYRSSNCNVFFFKTGINRQNKYIRAFNKI